MQKQLDILYVKFNSKTKLYHSLQIYEHIRVLTWRPTLQRLATFPPTCGYGVQTGLPGGGAEVVKFPGPTGAGGDSLWEECTGLARPGMTGVLTLVVTTTQCPVLHVYMYL